MLFEDVPTKKGSERWIGGSVAVAFCISIKTYLHTNQSNPIPSPSRTCCQTNQLMDIRYTELVAAPVKTIEAIYAKFGLPGRRLYCLSFRVARASW